MNFYKNFQISVSVYAKNKKLHIARDGSGAVRFREQTQKQLYQAIDDMLEWKRKLAERQAKDAAKRKKLAAKKRKGLLSGKSTNESAKAESPRKKNFWG